MQMQLNLSSSHSALQDSDQGLCSALSLYLPLSKLTGSKMSLTVADEKPEFVEYLNELYEWMEDLVSAIREQQPGGDTQVDKALRCVLATHIIFGKEAGLAPGRALKLIWAGMDRDRDISLWYWDKLVPNDKTARLAGGSTELLLSAVGRKRIGSTWNIYAAC